MNVLKLQKKLKAAGYNPGPLDGDIGPKTYAALLNWLAKRDLGERGVQLARGMSAEFRKYGITSRLRLSHFLAQAAHETTGFRHLQELGSGKDANRDGYDDYLQKYDFRKDLGNNGVGMGPKYRGRGIFQLTGLFNYTLFGGRIGINLAKYPERAAEPEVSVTLACLFWSDRKLNALADKDDVTGVTRKINGGTNGIADRRQYLARLKELIEE